MSKQVITYQDLLAFGYKKGTARKLIKIAKKLLVEQGFSYYKNPRVGQVPLHVIIEITNL